MLSCTLLLGTIHLLAQNNVGIGITNPQELLHVVGGDILLDRASTDSSGLTRHITIGGARSGSGNAFAELRFQNFDANTGTSTYTGAKIHSENPLGSKRGDLRFATYNGSLITHMVIDPAGNVGINELNPSEYLVVGDDIGNFDGTRVTIGDDSGRSGLNIGENGSNRAQIMWDNFENSLQFSTREDGEAYDELFVLKNGNAGVRNSNPTSQLSVGFDFLLNPDLTGDTYVTIGDNGAFDESALFIGSAIGTFAKMSWQETRNNLRFDLFTGGTPNIGVLLLDNNGKVGIKNPNLEPSELLSVGDDFGSALGGNRITIANESGTSGLNMGEDIDNRAFILWSATSNLLSIGTRSAAATYGQTLVVRDGKIGITNGNPLYNLHVGDGNINATNLSNTRMVVSDNTNGDRAAVLGLAKTSGGLKVEAQLEANGSSSAGPSVIVGSSTSHPLYLRTSNLTRVTVNTSGQVGIGTTSPSSLLEVNGSAAKPGGGVWTASSDARLKQDVRTYNHGLDDILKIRPVTYRYNALSGFDTSTEHIGVIAQELHEIAPYMVESFEKDGQDYLSVDASAITYMLINAVKELSAETATLKAEVDELRAMRAELDELKALLVAQGYK